MSQPRSPYIVSPGYDWAFFLLPPALSLALGITLAGTGITETTHQLGEQLDSLAGFTIGTIIHAHLVAVFFRSHGNPAVRKLYPWRFFVVPLVLFTAVVASAWVAVVAVVVATFWDVWHSGAQTFGFTRIYERNAGVPPDQGRTLDFWLNQLLYAGPILAGATLMDHVESFDSFADVGDTFFSAIPAQVDGRRQLLFWLVLAAGTVFVAYYLYAYWRMYRRGYRFSFIKVWLLASTGITSIYTWGFNSWGQAFFIMNLFHGVQYLALVWAMERTRIATLFRVPRQSMLAAPLFLAVVAAYGLGVQAIDSDLKTLWSITIVVSLMHFWYDAFIWSVRKSQV
jgi:hypothetical protein